MTIQLSTARRAVLASIVTLAIFGAQCACASPTASGKASDLNIEVDLLGLPVLVVTPQDKVEFANLSISFNDSQVLPSLALGSSTLVSLSTAELSAATQWIPSDNFLAIGSRAVVADVHLSALDPTALGADVSLLDIAATQIESTAVVTGTCPTVAGKPVRMQNDASLVDDYVFQSRFELQNLTPGNTSGVPGLQIDIAGTSILNIPSNPLPNTSIDIGAVGSLMLNKQSILGDGISSLTSIVDGLLLDVHLKLGPVRLLDATVDISHSEASIACN